LGLGLPHTKYSDPFANCFASQNPGFISKPSWVEKALTQLLCDLLCLFIECVVSHSSDLKPDLAFNIRF
jgi:hypothetical protein